MLEDIVGGASSAMNVQLSLDETYADISPAHGAGSTTASVSITRGCNNMCSFCIVPFTRCEAPSHMRLQAAWHAAMQCYKMQQQ